MAQVHAGLDLSRRRLDVCLLCEHGELIGELAVPPDADGLAGLVARTRALGPVRGVIESMTGARFVHDTLEQHGWDVRIADAHRVKGLAPLACKTDKIDSRVLALLSHRELIPEIWLPDPRVRAEREQARFRLHLVKHKEHAQAPDPRHDDDLRAPLPGHRPIRRRWPRAARPPPGPAAVARNDRREPVHDRLPQDRDCRHRAPTP
jgi:Transposase